ncbi:GNAT family N-acetyltransferase [Virgibacillus oceani]|uniref:Acetyltransferase n=1 Tax=Virgibacillus oceani TaxID=1479511 RepID=A0A917HUH0_9BACI|nr:GNAT family N-acetyltransferase [Virgibacillus oceani]GGG88922.1 acetyltransferase [Virgibacillus oceani]
MENITFGDIYNPGQVVFENDRYKHIHYPEMLIRYDSNYIEFKMMPSVAEFIEAANYLTRFHRKYGQKHIKFYFPGNEKPSKELMNHFMKACYEVGYNELYAIQPKQFPNVTNHPDIDTQTVTDTNFQAFLELQYETDLEFGEEFANQKEDLHKRNFLDSHILQILATYKGIPAGSVDVIISEKTAEIDGLSVKEPFRKKGIASRLQKYVMDCFPDRTIILVADGEDTPREMYRRQNYHYLGFKYEVQMVYSSND